MHLNEREREYYEAQQKRYLDETSRIQEAVDEAVDKAVEKAALNKQLEIAKNAIKRGADNDFIADITGLTIRQIEQLRHEK